MKMWEHRDLCLSVAKINAYRTKDMPREVVLWINELQDKLKDLKECYEKRVPKK